MTELKLGAWEDRYVDAVVALWNGSAVREGYKELTRETFAEIFTANRYFDPACAFVLPDGGEVRGFACGCTGDDLPLGDVAGYITCIVLAEGFDTDANRAALLDALETRFRTLGKRQSEVLFFNPMRLPWYIPGTPGHEHNNAPGVPADAGLYRFLLSEGYADRARQCAMYRPLADFAIPADIRAKEAKAEEAGYAVELFDPRRHTGLAEMLAGLDNPAWEREIAACAADGVPVVIAAAPGGQAAGFAGPVVRQDNGRGYFAGIGVHPDHEGCGLGSILFFKLCEALRDVGADYMSLFTGSGNPAIRIYEKAGFDTVRQFAIMRKELTQ
ncbi:GNAT family N-acetyltransferase [Cohnella rhizosphaerae]|uniref:GNAT family N-acetyltransferase n=1 Tax=Cohnella rhizosphaerae TaxID=1457232 RepID=A0A9X4QSQ9_9BACL|nr:GNAT family N-acetyltransferase [Cohnella rhizosphaerae]MDG0809564.1 GNAT family N-acetyltransferase [Cohnella rhizosphaerae]